MPNFWAEALSQTPALALFVVFTFVFLNHLRKKDDSVRDIAASCHKSHEKVAGILADVVAKNTEIHGEVLGELKELRRLRTEANQQSAAAMEEIRSRHGQGSRG
jgi:hypothetical protein